MPEIIRTRETRYRDDYSSDDERSSYGHSRHGSGYKSVQRYRITPRGSLPVEEIEDDRRSDRLAVDTRSGHLEVDRRVERVERIERPRSALEYREPERDREVKRTIVYERERDRSPEPSSARGWERDRDRGFEHEKETDVRIERRHRDRHESPVEVERYTREVDYYSPADAPQRTVVIRRRSPERERERERDRFAEVAAAGAGAGAYEIVRREQVIDNREIVPRRQEEDYYYNRREVRDVEPRRNELVRRERRHRSDSDGSDSASEVIVRKKIVKERERSHSPRHKLHLAEGALAGAGAAAILANHRDKSTGNGHDHRGRKILAGAALGTLGAELATRARSRIRDRSREVSRSRSRSRSRSSSRSGHHTKLKTGLALAATAIASAAAAKYISNRNERKEELARGRSRTRSVSRRRRYSSDDPAISKHTDPKHRAATAAKAGAAAAAVAGVVEHFRNKSKGRSKSRLRTGGIVAATGLAGAAVAGLYEARKAKQDAADDAERGRNHTARSLSRPRSLGGYSEPGVDPELGMVEYGGHPVYSDPAAAAAERSRERRRSRSRSKSKVRDIATGALATGAAAIGIDRYKKRKEKKEAERERRRYEEESPPVDNYYANQSYDEGYSPSPPRGSGGAFYPGHNFGGAAPPPAGYAPDAHHVPVYGNEYPQHPPFDPTHNPAYHPADIPPPQAPPVDPYGYPAPREAGNGGHVSSPTLFAPQAKAPPSRNMYNMTDEEGRLIHTSPKSVSSNAATMSPPDDQPYNKTVAFAPLSPESARRLEKTRRRRNSDPSSDRPNIPSNHRRRRRNASQSPSPTASLDDVEVLPDRFDKDGRPIDGDGYPFPRQPEMVERIVHDFEDLLDGRQSWKSLLRGFFEEAAGDSRSDDGGGGGTRRRR